MVALLLVAHAVVLVVPPAPRGDAPDWASFGVAEVMTDLVSQSPAATWISLKQLDAVLRRRDLRISQVSDPEVALPLARTVGATDAVVGDLRRVGDRYYLTVKRIAVATHKAVRSFRAQGTEAELPAMSAAAARALLEAAGPPMVRDGRAFEAMSRCGLGLVRHPLRPDAGAVPPLEDHAAVEGQCGRALLIDPKLGYARAAMAVLLALKGRSSHALEEASLARTNRFVALAWLAESFAARKAKDGAGARRALEDAVRARPGFLHALGYLAEDRMEQQDYKGALAVWDRYLVRAPEHPFALGQKGHTLAHLGRIHEALAITRHALEIDPGNAELLIELASRQIDAGEQREAEKTLRRALEIYPPRPLAKLRLGYLYLMQKRAGDAGQILSEAATEAWREDEAPTRGLIFADLARVAGLLGKVDEAVAYLDASRAEGAPAKLPCDAPELKGFKGKPQFDAVCK
jgi:tetratricopeptide (TPR) repeat protein